MTAVYITGGPFNGGERRVRKFDKAGTQLAEFWPESAQQHGGPPYVGTAYDFAGGDTNGDESLVFVADPTYGVVHKFDADLNLLDTFGGGIFQTPTDVCVIGTSVYVCDKDGGGVADITRWDFSGTHLDTWGGLNQPTAFDIAVDGDTVYYVSFFSTVRKYVLSTGVDSPVVDPTAGGTGGIRVNGDQLYFGDYGTVGVYDTAGTLIDEYSSTESALWACSLDPDLPTDVWTVSQNWNNSPVFRFDTSVPYSGTPQPVEWYADSEGFRDGWLFMRRRNPTVTLGRPRARGRHVPHPIRARGRERGVNPAAPRARGRQAT